MLDNGLAQKVFATKTDDLPISLVILMQTGGNASSFFQSYADLPHLVQQMVGVSEHEITLVTFDSRVEQIWHFPKHSDGVVYALEHPIAGDGGAAIMDAVSFGVGQLQAEAGRFRRVVLLLSQGNDEGSHVAPTDLVMQLGTASTVVHSIVFAGGKKKNRRKRPRTKNSNGSADTLAITLRRLGSETAAEISTLTGGDCVRFTDQRSFNSGMLEIEADTKESLTLGFQPSEQTPGLHGIRVKLANPSSDETVIARGAYWYLANPR